MKILTVASFKGGVGKTTLAVNIASSLSELDKKVLSVDFDPNNNLTDFYFSHEFDNRIMQANAYHFLARTEPIKDCIYETTHGVDCLPATLDLHRIGLEMATDPVSLLRLKKQFNTLNYDYVVIDTPPAISYEMRAGVFSADSIITPVAPSRWVFQAVGLLMEELSRVEEGTNFRPELMAVPSMVSKQDLEKIRHLSQQVNMSQSAISRAVAVRRAADSGKQLKQHSKSHEEFTKLVKEII